MDKDSLGSMAYSQVPLDYEGKLYDVYVVNGRFLPGKQKLSSIRVKKPFIRGVVGEDDLPKINGTFKIYHTALMGVAQYGVLTLDNCDTVIEEDSMIYFTGGVARLKYLLKPAEVN